MKEGVPRTRVPSWALAALVVLLTGGCTRPSQPESTGAVHVLEPAVAGTTVEPTELPAQETMDPECSRSLALAELATMDEGLPMLVRAADLNQEQDVACGAPDDFERQCRALFYLSSTEPSLVWASGGDWPGSVSVWQFAVDDGAASSSPDFVLMWAQLQGFVDGLDEVLAANDEATLSDRLIVRGDVADNLAVLEDACMLSGG